ncbi:aminoglycoside phosphotransferase family protein [Kribbella sp. NBC_00382]|uniref:aminoglycoside phosphotransferase family protein n=1 Tax=Kribbella sp. NBC_00382 TaxID=2975967 RepID=UPI002E1B9861
MPISAEQVAHAFGLGAVLEDRPLANGDRPAVTRIVSTTTGRWVVKHDHLASVDRPDLSDWQRTKAWTVHRLESAAAAAGIPMPRPVQPPEPNVGFWYAPPDAGGDLARVTEWVEGRDLRDARIPDEELAPWLGSVLARIARLDVAVDQDADASPVHPLEEWRDWVREAEGAADPALGGAARAVLGVAEDSADLIADALRNRPPLTMTHGDAARANILAGPDGLVLIDWESATADVPWWDAASNAVRLAAADERSIAGGDPRIVRPLIASYRDHGGPAGPADATAFAGLLVGHLSFTAWCLWVALGHRDESAEQVEFCTRSLLDAAEHLPRILRQIDDWASLLD